MRTTVRLDDALLEQAKAVAASRSLTLTALIEQGLRLAIVSGGRTAKRHKVNLPVCRAGGGVLPGVEIDNSAKLLDIMEGRL